MTRLCRRRLGYDRPLAQRISSLYDLMTFPQFRADHRDLVGGSIGGDDFFDESGFDLIIGSTCFLHLDDIRLGRGFRASLPVRGPWNAS